ncbi:MAG: DUF2807 domain-containing protein [Bacteroidales bacterium]
MKAFSKISILFLTVSLLSLSSCNSYSNSSKNGTTTFRNTKNLNAPKVKGQGEFITQTLILDNISGIDLKIAANIFLSQGNEQSVKVIGQKNIIDSLTTKVKNGIWELNFKPGIYKDIKLDVYIVLPTISNIKVSGLGDIKMGSFDGLTDLDIMLSGASLFIAEQSSTVNGTLKISNSGTSLLDCFAIDAEICKISLSGVGKCNVTVNSKLDVNISGVGIVNYKGYPAEIEKEISGIGKLYNSN